VQRGVYIFHQRKSITTQNRYHTLLKWILVLLRCAFTVTGRLLRAVFMRNQGVAVDFLLQTNNKSRICLVFFIQLVISFTLSVFVPTMIFFGMLFAMTIETVFAMTIETVFAMGIEPVISILAGAARRCTRVGIGRGLHFRLDLAFRTSPIIQHIVYGCTLNKG
jgi:hypothetical protein